MPQSIKPAKRSLKSSATAKSYKAEPKVSQGIVALSSIGQEQLRTLRPKLFRLDYDEVDRNWNALHAPPDAEQQSALASAHNSVEMIRDKVVKNPSGFITNAECAQLFGVSRKTIRSWVNGQVVGRKLTAAAKRGMVLNSSITRLLKPQISSH